MSNHSTISYSTQGRLPLSAVLTAHGAGFVKVRPPGQKYKDWRTGEPKVAKGKEAVGIGWQKKPHSLSEAIDWIRDIGGNIGLAGGHNNLILLDADANADQVVAAEPRLRNTLKIHRRNAPDRAKWVVRIIGDLPPSCKKHGVLEILSTGAQGVIFGRHESGALVEHEGDQIVALTTEDIRKLWRTLTGDELGVAKTPGRTEAPPDIEAVQRSMATVEAVLAHGALAHTPPRAYNGGAIVELHQCPFVERTDEPDRQHDAPNKSFVYVDGEGRINAGCQTARCQHAIEEHGSGWGLLKEIVGYQPTPATTPDLAHARTLVDYLREWVRRTDLAEHVPLTKQAINGYRTRDTDTVVADAILDVAHERGRLTGLVLTLRDLRRRTNLGSLETAANALDRLAGWFVVEEPPTPEGYRRWGIHSSLIDWANEQIDVARCCVDRTRNYLYIPDVNTRTIYATSPMVTHRRRDAFSSAQRPMTEEELQAKIDARLAQIAAGEDVRPIDPARYRRKLAATLPSLGRTVLRLIDALATEGGECSRTTLREMLNLSSAALSRTVKRAAELGLIAADRKNVRLDDRWGELVDAFEPYMPTAGRAIDREIADLNAIIRNAQRMQRQPDADTRRWERRIMRCARRKQELARLQGQDLPLEFARLAPPSAREMMALQRLAQFHAQAQLDLAAERHADAWRLPAEVRRLRETGVKKRDAWRMLEMGGWQRGEVAGVMAAVWPAKEVQA